MVSKKGCLWFLGLYWFGSGVLDGGKNVFLIKKELQAMEILKHSVFFNLIFLNHSGDIS